jgi:hypothetical protein
MVAPALSPTSPPPIIEPAPMRRRSLERKLLVVLLCAPLIGLLGVVLAELVPDGRIGYHLVRARSEGILSAAQYSESPLGTTIDHYTECIALSVGLGDGPNQNILETALTSPTYGACVRLNEQLDRLVATGTLGEGTSYLRYWHGYAVVTRPAIGLFGLAGARWVAFGLLATVVAGMAISVNRRFGVVAAGLLVAPALLTTDMVIGGLSVEQSLGIATAWAAGWLAFVITSRRPTWHTAFLAAALGGALNAYVDLMTTIPGSLGLAAVGAMLGMIAAGRDPALRETWRVAAAAVAGWTVGLVYMWGAKWALAAIAVGVDEVVDNVRSQIEFRVSGEYRGVSRTPTRGLTDNLGEWVHRPLSPWVLIAALTVLAGVLVGTRRRRPPWARIAVCVAIVSVPVVAWYVALNNHSQIHAWLVYRSLPIVFGGLCAFVYVALRTASDPAALDADADEVRASEERERDRERQWSPP